jgi:hypothetical protein
MALQKKKFVTPEIKQSGFFLQYLSCRGVCVMPVLAPTRSASRLGRLVGFSGIP